MYICISVFFIITNLCVVFGFFSKLRKHFIDQGVVNKRNHAAENEFYGFLNFLKCPFLMVGNELHF